MPSVWYGVPLTVDSNSSACHGTLMGQLEIKNDNKSTPTAIKKNTKHIDFIDIFCYYPLPIKHSARLENRQT